MVSGSLTRTKGKVLNSKNKSSTSCCILGAGAIGMIFAAYFKRIGMNVYVIHHRNMPKTVFEVQVCDSDLSGNYSFEIAAPENIEETDFILVTTKATEVLSALKGIKDVLKKGSDVVILSNGMGFHEKAQETYGSTRIFAATTTEAAHISQPGIINHSATGRTVIGEISSKKSPDWLPIWLNAIPNSSWTEDIRTALWEKLAINCVINPLTASHECRNGELIENPILKELAKDLCLEIEMVIDAAKIPHAKEPLFDIVSQVIFDTATNFSSMFQDVKAERTTEIESITGYLVETAARFNVDVPMNNKLLKQLQDTRFSPN